VKRPILFFDFDNTITRGDVLDEVIERFSAAPAWREWEAEWQAGRMSTADCLALQMGNLRASPEALREFVSEASIDPAFAAIVDWARRESVEVRIVSDSFSLLIGAILARHGLSHVPVFANELDFRGDVPVARFPFRDPACPRCAHCKARHLRAIADRARIYVGDGLSDVCPALIADVVYAKDSLAADLARRGVPFRPFASLAEVLRDLHREPARLSTG
jgi:2,3-diketo-5-methylthio-1-phosphopentane phosphatase